MYLPNLVSVQNDLIFTHTAFQADLVKQRAATEQLEPTAIKLSVQSRVLLALCES